MCFEEDVCLVVYDPGLVLGVDVTAVVDQSEEVGMVGGINVPVVVDLHLAVGCSRAEPSE